MKTNECTAAARCWELVVRAIGAVSRGAGVVGAILIAIWVGGRAGAQCQAPWLPGDGVVGLEGTVSAMVRLPGGDLIVGGNFTLVSNVRVSNIARYSPTTRVWTALGSGTNATVRALAAMPNGDVIVGGDFTDANAPNTAFIARWNGSSWSSLGKGANLPVDALAVGPGGTLYAGGAFTQMGTAPAAHVAVWDGASWAAMGSGLDNEVDALAVLGNGDVVAGGEFHASDATAASAVARWNGSAWQQVGDGLDGRVKALAVGLDGRIYAGGSFANSGGVSCPRAAVFDGAWAPMGAGTDGDVNALAIRPTGGGGYQVVAGGAFANADAVALGGIGTFAGGVWTAVDGGVSDGVVSSVAVLSSGEIVAGGDFQNAGGGYVGQIGRWTGTDWTPLSPGTNGPVYCSAKIPGGFVVGGDFTIIGGVSANRIAKWDGTHWSALGKGMDASVRSLLVIDANNIFAGGEFRHADNLNAGALAKWNGSTWAEVGGGVGGAPDAAVYALARLNSGEIVVAGYFNTAGTTNQLSIARWDGAAWKSVGGGITGGSRRVFALAIRDNGDLLVGGNFTAPTLRLALWNGGAGWGGFGAGTDDPVLAILVLPGDSIVVGGQFSFAGGKFSRGVSAYDFTKSSWTNLGLGIKPAGGYVNALALDASGRLVIGGSFESVNNVPAANVARYDGGWAAVGAGFDGPVFTLAALSPLDLMAGGGFISSGSNISVSLAHWAPPDPPIIDASPVDASVCGGGNASFSVAVSSAGTKVLKWQIEPEPFSDQWVDLTDGQYASTGTTIIGSDTDRLKVNAARPPLARRIRCRVSTDCTSFAVSDPAQLRVCSADLDCDGSATPADFLVWFAKWNATAAGADIDGVPGVDLGDFFEFLNSYDQGC